MNNNQTENRKNDSSLPFQNIGFRIAQIRASVPQAEFAKSIGIHKSTLIRYEKEERLPDSEVLAKICEVYEVDPAWLITGKPMPEKEAIAHLEQLRDSFVYMPLYEGPEIWHHSQALSKNSLESKKGSKFQRMTIAFEKNWVLNDLHCNPEKLILVCVDSDSMLPTLHSDDILLVDTRHTQPDSIREGIHVLRLNNSLVVKRLQCLPGGMINVTSDNPAYAPFTLNLASGSNGVVILGRVIKKISVLN